MSRRSVERLWGAGGVRLLLGDLAVIAVLGAGVWAVAAPRAAGDGPATAIVRSAGGSSVLDLRRDGVTPFTGPLGVTEVEVRGGRVRVRSSPCPRQSCRHGGWVGKAGGVLACLPNQIVVRVDGSLPGAPDAVSR